MNFGLWSVDAEFYKSKYLRQKCYIYQELDKENISVTVAGLPKNISSSITFESFDYDFSTDGKLDFKHVKGGVVLVNTNFTIK